MRDVVVARNDEVQVGRLREEVATLHKAVITGTSCAVSSMVEDVVELDGISQTKPIMLCSEA